MNKKLFVVIPLLVACIFACGEDKKEKVKKGVIFAASALQQANANPLSKATFQGYMRNGNPVDYIKAILPKQNPPFDSYEFKNPTHPWTIVIRPGTDRGEFYIEGYGADTKQPLPGCVEQVTVEMPEE